MMTLDEASKWFGYIGGVTGPIGLYISYLSYRRDTGHLRVRLRRGMRITQGPGDSAVRAMLKQYDDKREDPPMDLYTRDPDKAWAIIEVVNVGRRKVRLLKVGWKIIGERYVIAAGFLGYPGSGTPWLPCDLEEGEARDFPVEDDHLKTAGYAFACISTGRVFHGGFRNDFRGLIYRITSRLPNLKPKS